MNQDSWAATFANTTTVLSSDSINRRSQLNFYLPSPTQGRWWSSDSRIRKAREKQEGIWENRIPIEKGPMPTPGRRSKTVAPMAVPSHRLLVLCITADLSVILPTVIGFSDGWEQFSLSFFFFLLIWFLLFHAEEDGDGLVST